MQSVTQDITTHIEGWRENTLLAVFVSQLTFDDLPKSIQDTLPQEDYNEFVTQMAIYYRRLGLLDEQLNLTEKARHVLQDTGGTA